jgi:hypothetical protein
VRRVGRHRLQRGRHDLRDLVVAELARGTRARLVGQAVQALGGEALAPGRHGQARDPEPLGDRDVGQAARG